MCRGGNQIYPGRLQFILQVTRHSNDKRSIFLIDTKQIVYRVELSYSFSEREK